MRGYKVLAERGDVRLAFCWSHVRRSFYELAQAGPAPIASEALSRIAELYKIEGEIKGRGSYEIRALLRNWPWNSGAHPGKDRERDPRPASHLRRDLWQDCRRVCATGRRNRHRRARCIFVHADRGGNPAAGRSAIIERIKGLDRQVLAAAKSNPTVRLFMTAPGVADHGPVSCFGGREREREKKKKKKKKKWSTASGRPDRQSGAPPESQSYQLIAEPLSLIQSQHRA